MPAFIGCFDWNRLPTAEWERHYLQNGHKNQNTQCKCIDCMHATDYACKCITKCLVQRTVAPPSWSVYVRNKSLFWLWQVLYRQSPRITSLMVFLHKFVDVEKRRSWGVSRIWPFRGHFVVKSCLLLYGQDASWELTCDLDWRFPTCLGRCTLKFCIFNVFEASEREAPTRFFVFCGVLARGGEP